MNIILEKSDKPEKRFKVIIDGKKTIHFGQKNPKFGTFIDHQDIQKRAAYIARHKVNEDFNNIMTAGFWSRWLLWSAPTISSAINLIEKKFNVKITKR